MTPRNHPSRKHNHNHYSAPKPPPVYQHPNRPQWLSRHPEDIEIVFFDLETTGGNPANSDVIEIAAIKEVRGKVVGRFESLVNPRRPIPKMVRSITGIDNAMVRDAPPIEELIDDLLAFIGDAVLISHGVLNDFSFIANYARKLRNVELKNYYVCTHLVVSNFLPNIPTKSLSGVAGYFGITVSDAHRAMGDADATRHVFWKIQEACERNGFKTLEDLLKIQADNQTLSRLGPGLLARDAERAPTTPGLLYLFNLNREVAYVAATQNIRRSLMNVTELCDEREFNRLLVDISDFKFERTTHFLDALLREKRELKKLRLPIDPRKYEGRANGFLQIILPEDMLAHVRANPDATALPLTDILDGDDGLWDDLDLDHEDEAFVPGMGARANRGFVPLKVVPAPKAIAFDDNERNKYAYQSWTADSAEGTAAVPIRKTRRIISTVRSAKFQLVRPTEAKNGLNVGFLQEGFGWCFGPFEQPKVVKKQFEDLITLWPFHDDTLEMETRFENLQYIVRTLHGQLQAEIEELKSERQSLGSLFRPLARMKTSQTVELLEAIKAQNWQLGRSVMPRSGLAIVSNNDLKELDVFVVVRGTVRRHVRLPGDDTDKLQSPRYFTRLFKDFHEEMSNALAPFHFTEETCTNLEMFAYWLHKRRGEGEWVDFEDLEPLFDLSLM